MTFLRIGKLFSVYVTLIVLLTGCVSSTEGQATPTVTKSVPETTREIRVKPWYRIYEEETDNSGSDLLVLPDSGLLVVGGMGTFGQEDAIGGAMLLWTDAAGDILRQEVYGGQGFDVGWDIAPAVDGGYILVGETTSFGDGESDGYVVRIEETGQVKWEKVFGGQYERGFWNGCPDSE